jgi:hypothetical protein
VKVWGVHNRPIDNNCFDDFARWTRKVGLPFRYVRWSRFDASKVEPDDRVVCLMMDPIGTRKASVFEDLPVVNHPTNVNRCVRDVAYPIWTREKIPCPGWTRPYLEGVSYGYPFLLKETGKQMGRGYLVNDDERLRWVTKEAKRFDPDRFRVVPFIDTRWSDGYFRAHRWLVCGSTALPVTVGKTKGWNCKAGHTPLKRWTEEQRDDFAREYVEHWNRKRVPRAVVRATRSLGLDFGMVDATLGERGKLQIVWEVNPQINLNPRGVPGKPKRDFALFARFIFPEEYHDRIPDPAAARITEEEVIHEFTKFKGFKPYWRVERDRQKGKRHG